MKYLYLCSFILLISACAGVKETGKEPDTESDIFNSQYDESFDPLSLNDDDITIQKDQPDSQNESEDKEDINSDQSAKETGLKELDGWRVQILATKNIENATLIHQEAVDQFAMSNIKAYLIFEAPLYKVRIGDARDRNEAEVIRDLSRDYGYIESFIVRSKIMIEQGSE